MTERKYVAYKLQLSFISHSLFNSCSRFVGLLAFPHHIWHTTDLCDVCSTIGGKGAETKDVTTELFVSHSTQLL